MLYNFDLELFYWFNSWTSRWPRLDTVIIFLADKFGYLIILGLLLFGIFSLMPIFPRAQAALRKNWEMILLALFAGGVARFGITEIIRFLWHRLRPFEALSGVHQLLAHERGASFPSGHAVFYFAIAAVVSRYYPGTSILFYLAALLTSIARVMAGIHWPLDVVFGALIGVLTGITAPRLYEKFKNKT